MADFGKGQVINSGGADNMGADVISSVVSIEGSNGVGIEITVVNTGTVSTGTAVGTLQVQISNSGVNWTSVELSSGASTITVATGTDNTEFLDLSDLNARFLRVWFDRTSGDGILDAWTYVRRVR